VAAAETNDTHQASDTVGTTDAADTDQKAKLRQDADRMDNWSKGWILLALLAWAWFAYLMIASYGPDITGGSTTRQLCDGPLVDPFPQSEKCRTYELRQWPALLGVLALTVVLTVVAAATTVYTQLLSRLAEQAEQSGSGKAPETGHDSV
jgi:hypothetical protein